MTGDRRIPNFTDPLTQQWVGEYRPATHSRPLFGNPCDGNGIYPGGWTTRTELDWHRFCAEVDFEDVLAGFAPLRPAPVGPPIDLRFYTGEQPPTAFELVHADSRDGQR